MDFDVLAALTLPSGHALDSRFFFDFNAHEKTPSRRNQLDREAEALMLTTHKNIGLFRSNQFYKENRPSLYDHETGLLTDFLSDPRVHALIEKNDPLVPRITRGLSRHDGNESLFEEQSYKQKSDPLLPKLSQLETYKQVVTVNFYHAAQGYAAQGMHDEFIADAGALQVKYAAYGTESENLEKFPAQYEVFMNRILLEGQRDVRHLTVKAMGGISEKDMAAIRSNDLAYYYEYKNTEDPVQRLKSVEALVVKSYDKNCGLFTKHDYTKDPSYTGHMLEREGSRAYLRTAQRALEFMMPLYQQTHETGAAIYFDIVADHTYKRLIDYTSRQQPVMALKGKIAEPLPTAPKNVFDNFCAAQTDILNKRRKKIHPLKDVSYLGRDEIIAKIMTQSQRGGTPDPHLLDNQFNYARASGYIPRFDENLEAVLHTRKQLALFA